ncbi:MAG: protein kinase [Legionellaceae bacterium]|nr:protein kinase [Legionellaceae bacterium]MBP9774794.1 protein kinase [Legionellaceae bacterium]
MQSRASSNIIPIIEPSALEIDDSTQLGAGGYGRVFKGTWGATDVAIKRSKTTVLSEQSLKDLQEEARKHYALTHPNIVILYGVSWGPGHYCLVMARMSCSLRDLLSSNTPLSPKQVYRIARGTIEGICYLHANGIIHRDLTSFNILIDREKGVHPCITDFGLSKMQSETAQQTPEVTAGSFVVEGSPRWMAPEIMKNLPCSTLSDIYSFGVILWELFARKLPFSDADNQEIIRRVRRGEREPIPEETPITYAKLIRVCEQQNPTKRPQTAQLLVNVFIRRLKTRETRCEMPPLQIEPDCSKELISNIESVDNSTQEALCSTTYRRDHALLGDAKTYWAAKDLSGSCGQAAGRRHLNCQQTLSLAGNSVQLSKQGLYKLNTEQRQSGDITDVIPAFEKVGMLTSGF